MTQTEAIAAIGPECLKPVKAGINQVNIYFMKQFFTLDRIIKVIIFVGLTMIVVFAFAQHTLFYKR